MTLGEAVLTGDARAWGRLSDVIREHGGTYKDAVARVQAIYKKAGRPEPTEADFEDKMQECEHLEARG